MAPYATFLDIAFLALAVPLGWRFLRTGGLDMLRAMEMSEPQQAALATDPVCGMTVDPSTSKLRSDFGRTAYYFCSSGCKAEFDKDPARYVTGDAPAGHQHHHH